MVKGRGSEQFLRYMAFYEVEGRGMTPAHPGDPLEPCCKNSY